MLTTLDRYILGKFMQTFFFMVLIFTIISVVIDFSDKLDSFLDDKISWSVIIFDYYLTFIPNINGLLFPLYSLMAVVFFTSRMAFDAEIISIIGSGVPYNRFLRPYIIGAVLLASLHLLGNHFIIPMGNKKRVAFENQYFWKNNIKSATQNLHMYLKPDVKVYMQSYNPQDSTALGFSIETFKGDKLASRLNAVRAEWKPYRGDWQLFQYTVRTVDGMDEHITNGMNRDTVIAWLAPMFKPKDIERRDNLNQTMTTPALIAFIKKEKERGSGGYGYFEVELQRRSADAMTIIILTLIGVALAGRRVRGGMGLHLALGVIIGGAFIFLSRFAATLSINTSVPAYIGIWIPNFIFGLIALYLLKTAQK